MTLADRVARARGWVLVNGMWLDNGVFRILQIYYNPDWDTAQAWSLVDSIDADFELYRTNKTWSAAFGDRRCVVGSTRCKAICKAYIDWIKHGASD